MTGFGWVFVVAMVAMIVCLGATSTAFAARESRLGRWTVTAGLVVVFGVLALAALGLHFGARLLAVDPSLRTITIAMIAASFAGCVVVAVVGGRGGGGGRARSWPPFVLLACAVVLGLGAIGALVGLDGERLRAIEERRQASAAARALLVVAPVPDREAYRELLRIFRGGNGEQVLDAHADLALAIPAPGSERDAWLATLAPLLDECRPLLAQLEVAAALPAADFGFDPQTVTLGTLLPDLAPLRSIARVAALDAQRLAAAGDRAGAIERIVAIDRMADHLADTPSFMHLLVAMAIRSLATATMAAISADVDVDDRRLFTPDFDARMPERLRRALVVERAMFETVLLEIASTGAQEEIAIDVPDLPAVVRPLYRLVALPRDLARFEETSLRAAERALLLPTPRAAIDALDSDEVRPGVYEALIGMGFDSIIGAAGVSTTAVPLRGAIVALQGRPANDRDSVVLPIDPLDPNGRPLRMARKDGIVAVWTVGRNGQDDGGPTDAFGGDFDDVGIRVPIRSAGGG
jgi:hypothetical protein